jgi:hypothetical protein
MPVIAVLLAGCAGGQNTSSALSGGSSLDSTQTIPDLPYNEEHNVFSYAVPGLGSDVMPIGAWCAPWYVSETLDRQTDEIYGYAKESGINILYGLYERIPLCPDQVEIALDFCDKYDLQYFIRDESLGAHSEDENDFIEHVTPFTEHESFSGFMVCDEPSIKAAANYVAGRKLMREHFTKYAYYINTFPTYASSEQFGGETGSTMTYYEYADSYLEMMQPQMYSYDFYGMYEEANSVSDGYYEQLYLARELANKHRVPFWPFVLAHGWEGVYRKPTEQDIYWMVGSSLVYGAKGIQYFSFMNPYEYPDWTGNFVDYDGNKTELFPYFKTANEFIASVDGILMKSSLVGMMQYGGTPSPFPDEQQHEFVTSIREIQAVKTEGDILIGVFDHGGQTAIYILNNTLTDETELTIDFTAPVRADVYEFTSSTTAEGESITLSLKAGQSALVDLTNYK